MANNMRIIHTSTVDPWWNLAVEEFLLDNVEPGQCILYLWQNENTIVIGRNQNPWKEFKTELFESEGGKLARRLSGGGAVYHDMGNLNFTFISSREVYNLKRQVRVILDAVNSVGIEAQMSGRNDLTADGRKFSGNAFCFRKAGAYHHGTVLISADFSKMTKYLQVSPEKIRSKGIESVRSRVVNLTELKPDLTIDRIAEALIDSFRSSYNCTATVEREISGDKEIKDSLEELYCKYSSWKWRYGEAPKFDINLENRFSWGGVELCFLLENGVVTDTMVYSDAMDEAYISELPGIFKGCVFNSRQLAQRLHEAAAGYDEEDGFPGIVLKRQMTVELADWLLGKGF